MISFRGGKEAWPGHHPLPIEAAGTLAFLDARPDFADNPAFAIRPTASST
jgi:hypothetical protein